MLINKDGTINPNITQFLVEYRAKWEWFELDDNQFLQISPTGKRIELWEGKEEFLHYDDWDKTKKWTLRKVCGWNANSILSMR